MKKILLVCAAGMSTSLLVNKMKDAAKARGIEVEIEAMPIASASKILKDQDVILIGPQVRYLLKETETKVAGHCPVLVCDMKMYGRMDGEGMLNFALEAIGE